jgi:chemotaxis protein methyltransferase CheR
MDNNEFITLCDIVYQSIGIHIKPAKKHWIEIRLSKRLETYNFRNFHSYFRLIQANIEEFNIMINLVTINETSFFREIEHFDFLHEKFLKITNKQNPIKILSAASSIGAEAYSLAMLCESFKLNWQIVGTDINEENIKKARNGLYPLSFAQKIPQNFLRMYCLKGKNEYSNQFIIDKEVLQNVNFYKANLLTFGEEYGIFDIIFLRNVLIYFDEKTMIKVVNNLLRVLKQGGLLFTSQTEYLSTLHFPQLQKVQNSIFKKK